MPLRIAGILSLFAFAVCLVAGAFGATNPFSTIVMRALSAMACTFAVGLVVGLMAQKMLEENLSAEGRRLKEAREARIKALRERGPILEVGGEDPRDAKNKRTGGADGAPLVASDKSAGTAAAA